MPGLTKSIPWFVVVLLAMSTVVVGPGTTEAAAEPIGQQATPENGDNRTTPPSMTASFSCSPTSVAVDTPITCSANVSAGNGTVASIEWGFGNGTTASGAIVTHRYHQPGTYTIVLTVIWTRGSTTTVRRNITVRAANQSPTAMIDCSPNVVTAGDTVSCSATGSSDDRAIASFAWTFRSGSTATGNRVSHVYTTPGNRTVTLTVTDSDGATDTVQERLSVRPNVAPTAVINCTPTTITAGQRVSCTAAGSTDSDGSITSTEWRFGDGTTDTGSDVRHRYDQQGTYTVRTTVTDDHGLSATATTNVTVTPNAPPTGNISHSSPPIVAGRIVQFEAVDVRDPDGTVSAVEWRFGADTIKYGANVSYRFESGGDHTVAMTVVGTHGRQRTVRETVTVYPAPNLTIEQTPTQPRTGQDVVLSVAGELDRYRFAWDTDADGETETHGRKIVTTFEQAGKKPVRVIATSPTGVTTRRSTVLTVRKNAEFFLTSQLSSVESSESTDVAFSISNQVNSEPISAKLQLNAPSGVTISAVSGPGISTVQSTGFVTVDAGASERLQLSVAATEPGTYRIGGTVVYYYAGQETRRKTAVEPVVITVRDRASNVPASSGSDSDTADSTEQTAADGPGFGLGVAILAIVMVAVVSQRAEAIDGK
jgi:PKD repeat protein